MKKYKIIFFIVPICTILSCVERTVTINTEPKGALVYLNDVEVGRTPVKVPFQWYGDYDVIIRKEGYQTLKTHRKLVRPWYEYIPIDFFAEILTPAVIHDDHFWEFELEKATPVNKQELLNRAIEFRKNQAQQTKENNETNKKENKKK